MEFKFDIDNVYPFAIKELRILINELENQLFELSKINILIHP